MGLFTSFVIGFVVGWLLVVVPAWGISALMLKDLGDGNPFGVAIILSIFVYIVGPIFGVVFGICYAFSNAMKRKPRL